jgi:phenylacetic acid degradation protein paaN
MPDRSAQLFAQHRPLLQRAIAAVEAREYWSPFPDAPSKSIYGADAAAEGERAFQAVLNTSFELDQPGVTGSISTERSPFGFDLGIEYPRSAPEALVDAAKRALPTWRDAGPEARAGVVLEILGRINARSFELAHAVQHTTGQAFVMAFQAGGPHAQDRALEAVAYAYAESTRHASRARWAKPARGGDLVMDKTFTVVPRGVALVIGCNTFPTWNGYPGMFASLATGNPVIVKPHPNAVLPLAITVRIAREVLAEAGHDPNQVTLAVEEEGDRIAAGLARHRDVRIVDFTGSSDFGNWLEANVGQAVVYTEKSGLNTVIVDSTDDYRGMLANLAFSLSLYSGQMCTTPQNILVPSPGIGTDAGHKSVEEFGADLAAAVDALLSNPQRAAGTLGAIVNSGVSERLEKAAALSSVLRKSEPRVLEQYPEAIVRTPLLVQLDAAQTDVYTREWFGPISFVVTSGSTEESLRIFTDSVRTRGAITAAVYSTDPDVLERVRSASLEAGVNLSENLTGGVFVNQSAAFSDFHGTGANPAATTALSDPAFVTGRFHVLQSRRAVTEEVATNV